jgi:ornithine cyclodeaminase/alanine dehydrogenase
MDGTSLTALRTGAAAGVASKHLVSVAPRTIAFIGCGVQARTLHGAHRVVFREFETLAYDKSPEMAAEFAHETGGRVVSLETAASADIVCTATPSRVPFVEPGWVTRGAHINAMGADAPGKQELSIGVLRAAEIYIDDIHQAEGSGEINVPLSRGELAIDDLAGTLGEVVAGVLPKPAAGVTTVFDSTGLAIQDLALARAIYDHACDRGVGTEIDLVGLAE